jgi:hypothetical protein
MTDNRDLGFASREFNGDPVEATYRNALADGLERVLDRGADTLDEIVAGLNGLSVTTRDGARWTAESLASELEILGR